MEFQQAEPRVVVEEVPVLPVQTARVAVLAALAEMVQPTQ
jgi:hypothetical protein